MVKGRIHSFESMGLVDGPGIRTVVFFQGCKLRCAYCHNPDTWSCSGGTDVEPAELIKKILRFKPYFERSKGGVTFSGGEPLLQPEFLLEMLKLCKANNIHTTIDTAGYGKGNYEEILKYVDLVLLDIKHVTDIGYKDLTGQTINESKKFLDCVQAMDKKMWIRHVVVPGITDSEEHLKELADFIKPLKNVEKIELLPYHVLGVAKYENMNIPYRLEGLKPMNQDKLKKLECILKEELAS